MTELVQVDRKGHVALVTMNRPDAMNALSALLREQLASNFRALEEDDSVRAIVLTGAGDRAFCAGADLKELAATLGTASVDARIAGANQDPYRAILASGKPVIAAINGVAITGGLELALACDIRLASPNARFADTHGRVGIFPEWGMSQRLSRTIGLSRAMELSLSGNFITADVAEKWGLVNRLVAPDALLASALELAGAMTTQDPDFQRRYKALIRDGFELSLEDGLSLEALRSQSSNQSLETNSVAARREDVMIHGRQRK